jgi:hypothetical protein
MKLALLGPQRFDPNVRDAATALGVSGTVALVTAGWQERESEDEELSAHLGGRTVNLQLHRRSDVVFANDPEFRKAYRERQLRYRQLQDIYRIRLEHLIIADRVITSRSAPEDLLEEEKASSVNAVRMLDLHHQRQCARIRREFSETWAPASRPAVVKQRGQIAELLEECAAVAIAGGHVASLLNRLQLFGIAHLLGQRPVLAWSAGAMAITDHVVVFHDDPPHGIDAPQIMDVGLGLLHKVVALPNPETRLALDDAARMSMYARRFTGSTCLALPRRSWVVFEDDVRKEAHGVFLLSPTGQVEELSS